MLANMLMRTETAMSVVLHRLAERARHPATTVLLILLLKAVMQTAYRAMLGSRNLAEAAIVSLDAKLGYSTIQAARAARSVQREHSARPARRRALIVLLGRSRIAALRHARHVLLDRPRQQYVSVLSTPAC
jgi:hypothetical protein